MRIVDNDRHFVSRFGHDLKSAGNRFEPLDAALDGVERHVERSRRGDGREDVVDIGASYELRSDVNRASRRFERRISGRRSRTTAARA